MSLTSGKFWAETVERAVKTAAQTGVALLTADGVLNAVDVDWAGSAGVVALATAVSVLTSVASRGAGPDKDSPSVV